MSARETDPNITEHLVQVPIGTITLEGNLSIPATPRGVVLFAHGSGSSRHSPRNRFVAQELNRRSVATLLIDLLTPEEEEAVDMQTRYVRFDIDVPLQAERLKGATDWLNQHPETNALVTGYFGASTGAAVALVAAAEYPEAVSAIVSRGGRPDLAEKALRHVQAPTLLLVGEHDAPVIAVNKTALA